jgi:hypothetical protein
MPGSTIRPRLRPVVDTLTLYPTPGADTNSFPGVQGALAPLYNVGNEYPPGRRAGAPALPR